MRELKFRIWNGTRFVTKADTYIKTSNGSLWDYEEDYGGTFSSNKKLWSADGKIQQYTGLKDRYDKEIYEGDIVRAWNQGSSHVGEIRWRLEGAPIIFIYPAYHDGQFWFLHGSKTKDGVYVDRGIEIIGNIFENSELLKQ